MTSHGDTASINEKPGIVTAFYEELKFCFINTVECLLKHYDKGVKKYVKHLKSEDCLFLTLQVCNQYRKRLVIVHYREHRANAEKSAVEFDTKTGQKWVNSLDHQNVVKLILWRNIQITIMSKVDDDVGDESENVKDYDEADNESDKRFYLCFDYDATDDEFDERFISSFQVILFLESYFSYCTAKIINISDHEAVDQHSELKKWALENRVQDITDKEKYAISNYVLDVFERNVYQREKSRPKSKGCFFHEKNFGYMGYKWKSEFKETMSESTYTATWIAPDFEILKKKDPDLFNSSWCEMIHSSSKCRRRNAYKSNKKIGRKCDGILFIKSSTIERLVFENVCSPKKENRPKYYKDLNKSFRNAVDTLCKIFWTNGQDVEISGNIKIKVNSGRYALPTKTNFLMKEFTSWKYLGNSKMTERD
ncbi:18290_t:CDS:2 [Acaulospora morrowiae]|uniref:18290_t:CDS:1 n=1 Tax=Acaulospora morrowiae TaxID=94023 RepID=A0A9N9BY04_9GLOM|nr:18290_t:CDS:2 [Acaulospora morrowiae]